MLKYIASQMKRKPLHSLAVLIFAAVLSTILCELHAQNEKELENYENAWRTIPVTVTVTDLTGTDWDDLSLHDFVYNVFHSDFELGSYVKDIQMKTCWYSYHGIEGIEVNGENHSVHEIAGITSLEADTEINSISGKVVTWLDGYDESVLQSEEFVCILPENMMPENYSGNVDVKVHVSQSVYSPESVEKSYYDFTVRVVGTHNTGIHTLYCPFYVVKKIRNHFGSGYVLESFSAVMVDNSQIEEMWQAASDWFVEPSVTGKKVPWDRYRWLDHYPHALKIDDSQLRAAAETLENSLTINKICTVLVFALSAVAGFFVGFLMIRSRKREIALMRTMGTPNISIYGGFAFEQMLCVVLGTLLGGSAFRWQPEGRLLTFVCIYFVGLTVALLIFLHTNLISTIKEDE